MLSLVAVVCYRIHEKGNCGAEISKHEIMACIKTTPESMSLLPQYRPSSKGQTLPKVNYKRESFLFLFHYIMRVSQIEALEVQNKIK